MTPVTHRDLNEVQLDRLCDLYAGVNLSLDDLPYTDEFEELYQQFLESAGVNMERHFVWKALCNCRKASRLIRKSR
jgi:hypothetical protein